MKRPFRCPVDSAFASLRTSVFKFKNWSLIETGFNFSDTDRDEPREEPSVVADSIGITEQEPER